MSATPKILFVCTGNTCRSPMAEALWRAMGAGYASSAGVSAWSGLSAAGHAKTVVKSYGVSLDQHRARDLSEVEGDFDWIVTMTASQRDRVTELRPEWAHKTVLLAELAGESGDGADPAGQDLDAYRAVAEEIYRLLQKVKGKLGKDS